MSETPERNDSGSSQPYTHEDMIDQIRAPRTSGTGRSGRRRKRRSHQPKKQRERKVRLGVGLLFGIGLPLLVTFFLGLLWNKVRCESEGFREAINAHLSGLLHADVDVGQLQLQGRVLSALKVTVGKSEAGIVQSADLRRVSAQLAYSSFLGGGWKIQSLAVQEGELRLKGAAAGAGEGAGEVSTALLPARVLAAGLGLSNRPDSWAIDSVQVREFDLYWGKDGAGNEQSLRGSRIFGSGLSEGTELRLMGGEARLFPGQVFEFREANLRWESGKILIEKGEIIETALEALKPESHASRILFGGLVLPGTEARAELEATLEGLPVEHLLDPAWSERLGGSVWAEVQLVREFSGGGREVDWRGMMRMDGAWLKDLKVLDELAMLSKESRFRRVEFEDGLRCRVARDSGVLKLEEIEVEKPGLIKIAGAVMVGADSSLSGSLELGLPEALLVGFPGGKPKAFGEARAGFCYTEVLPGGTLETPTEDLGTRLSSRSPSPLAGSAPRPEALSDGGTIPAGSIHVSPGGALNTVEKQRLEELFHALLAE